MSFLDMAFPVNHTKPSVFSAEWKHSDPYPDKPRAEDVFGKLCSAGKKFIFHTKASLCRFPIIQKAQAIEYKIHLRRY